ncbi:MAG: transcriptional repressor [Lachnospiraceae bacterium]|nr:transcriptional repressor [Lachnospiraceae bacterium]
MNSRSKYRTRQREILLDYLKTVSGKHITAGDVCEYLKDQGAEIGQSTVYRHLESLVDEGLLNKYVIDPNSPACFEYVDPDSHEEGCICFHCRCEKCGILIHLHCDELEEIEDHLYKEHRFRLDPYRTVFYGLCDKCMEQKPGKAGKGGGSRSGR